MPRCLTISNNNEYRTALATTLLLNNPPDAFICAECGKLMCVGKNFPFGQTRGARDNHDDDLIIHSTVPD